MPPLSAPGGHHHEDDGSIREPCGLVIVQGIAGARSVASETLETGRPSWTHGRIAVVDVVRFRPTFLLDQEGIQGALPADLVLFGEVECG